MKDLLKRVFIVALVIMIIMGLTGQLTNYSLIMGVGLLVGVFMAIYELFKKEFLDKRKYKLKKERG